MLAKVRVKTLSRQVSLYQANEFAVFQSCGAYDDRKLVLYVSALKPMGAKLCFRYSSVNIGPSYK